MNEQLLYLKCTICRGPLTSVMAIGWCQACQVGRACMPPSKQTSVPYAFDVLADSQRPLGAQLEAARARLITEYLRRVEGPDPLVVEVHSGVGTLVSALLDGGVEAMGYEPDPSFLQVRKVVSQSGTSAISDTLPFIHSPAIGACFGSFQTLPEPLQVLEMVRAQFWVLSLPVYPAGRSVAGLGGWVHYRPAWNQWYFTAEGLELYFEAAGYELDYGDDFEAKLGVEDTLTFVFERKVA